MSVRPGTARRRVTALVASALLSATVAVAVPEAAAAAPEDDCYASAFEPELWTDGWTVNIGGTGIGYCNRTRSSVMVLVKRHISHLPDLTYGTGVGQQGEWIRGSGVCGGDEVATFYTEVRVGDVKVQSNRVQLGCA